MSEQHIDWKIRSDNWQKFCQLHIDENARLKAENERLRKAGDWMCGLLRFDFVTKEWNAAKEGKPSVWENAKNNNL